MAGFLRLKSTSRVVEVVGVEMEAVVSLEAKARLRRFMGDAT